MEGNEEEPNVARPNSFSPKVSRPKLPPFAGSGSRSGSPRAKTDPGRGEIKAIMEDIMNLKKTDWKTFSRSRTSPSARAKSASATTSPTASPRRGSPVTEESPIGLSRDRSKSLKLLTDRLKNKNAKYSAQDQPRVEFTDERDNLAPKVLDLQTPVGSFCSQPPTSSISVAIKGSSPSRRSPDRRSMERMYEQIPETPEEVEHEEPERAVSPRATSSEESFRSVPECQSEIRERTPDSDNPTLRERSPGSDDTGSTRSGDDLCKSKLIPEKGVPEDEGMVESGDHPAPVMSTYIYHPIQRNSKFLQLAATKPPKRFVPERRSGITMLKTHGPLAPGNLNLSGQQNFASDDQARQRSPRKGDIVKASAEKSGARFTTHPPHMKTSQHETGSMDTNGFAALRASAESYDEHKLPSQLSLADSQFASEMSDDTNYQDIVDSTLPESGIDRKNSKSSKQKSKSDPSGDRTREVLDFPPVIEGVQSQSAPLLSKEELEQMNMDKSLTLSDDDSRLRSHSETILVGQFQEDVGDDDGHSSCGEDEFHMPSEMPSQDGSFMFPSCQTSEVISAPGTPHGPSPSPVSVLERQTLLAVPATSSSGSGRKPNIFRSASSASVLQSRKPSASSLREKDIVRKHSINSDEAVISAKSSNSLVPDFHPLGDISGATSMPTVWDKDRMSSTDSPEREPGFTKDKRYHIVEELYKNEKEYVEALRTLKDGYMVPLKMQSNVDENIIDSIFYMIPEILTHHSIYLDFLDNVWTHWDTQRSTVGNIINTIFAKQTVSESYLSFVENYNCKAIENAITAKSSVQKFIEQCQRDSGSKLSMKDLIVRPIQRIPRYELLIQRLLDNTPADHPDHPLLKKACKVMHDLAVKIGTVNDSQLGEDMQDTLKKLELLLITDLAVPDRSYIRHDMVQLFNKKDQCCIWLFSDVIIISSIKRKSGPVTRKVSIILKTPYGQDFAENIKHKVWLRVGLDDLEIVKTQGTLSRKPTIDKEQVEDDLSAVTQMAELAGKLSCQHSALEDVLKELNTNLSRQLSEANARNASSDSNKLELLVTTQEGVLHLVIGFCSAEKRATWEQSFMDAKHKLSLLSDKRAPEFLQPLQITKTRAGMQFSCAASIDGVNQNGFRDVWVCNSDGYVGHMCLLSLQPEPIVTLNTPVPGCNARILCICAVPAFGGAFRRKTSQKGARSTNRDPSLPSHVGPHINVERADDEVEHERRQQDHFSSSRGTTSPSSETAPPFPSTERGPPFESLSEESSYHFDSDSSEDDDDVPVSFISRSDELYVGEHLSDDETPKTKVSELTENSPDPITTSGSWEQDPSKSTMWLGTEDGCIHIFQSCDNIKTTKNKLKIQHGSPVCCIIYLDNKVFVSLVNGDLIVYKRDHVEGLWDTECPYTRTIGSAASPITKMLAVAGKLWCGCQNQIHVINPLALNIETSFQVSQDTARCVQCLVSSGQGVWVASQQTSKVLLFHAVTYEFLMEVSIAQAVSQKLQSADDIIRQHKAACLRITTLMVCKDLLWVGTSAGVILTFPVPRITSTTTRGSLATPVITGLVYGHTGHVRFLTSVEMSSTAKSDSLRDGSSNNDDNVSSANTGAGFSIQDIHRRSSMAAATATMASRMLVISGGDGYEDFRNSATNEGAGRDDSTNHLLLWQV